MTAADTSIHSRPAVDVQADSIRGDRTVDLSIVVVNWNTRELLFDCLTSVEDNLGGLQAEIIVVDNASTDGSVEMVKTCFPNVVLLANDDNRGFAAANNQAFEIAGGRHVLLLAGDRRDIPGAPFGHA